MRKQNFMWILSAVLFITFLVYSETFADGRKINFNALPKIAQNFYTVNFGNMKIKEVEHDRMKKEYSIELWNENTITFNEKGEWIEVDCDNNNTVPESVIDQLPLMVKNKIRKDYINHLILEIKRNLKDPQNVKYSLELVDTNGEKKEVKL